MSPFKILTEDPRALPIEGACIGTLREFVRGESRAPQGAILIARRKGGSSRSWLVPVREEVRHA